MGHQVGWQEDREYIRKKREKEIIVWLNQLSPKCGEQQDLISQEGVQLLQFHSYNSAEEFLLEKKAGK